MAETINLICMDCREYLWIGQIPTGDRKAAYTYGNNSLKHARFCLKHWQHTLTVASENNVMFDDPELAEFEPEPNIGSYAAGPSLAVAPLTLTDFLPEGADRSKYREVTALTAYTVTDNGDIIGWDGEPFTGTVSSEHLRIAAERKAKRDT